MARQEDTEITGTIGNLIFYERHGKFLMRTVQKQAVASQLTVSAFGKASTKAKILRQHLAPLIRNPKDKDMQNRLTAAMRACLASMASDETVQPEENLLAGFRFAPSSSLKDCLKFPLEVIIDPHGVLVLEIPALIPLNSITAPAATSRVELQLMAVSISLNQDHSFASLPVMVNIPYVDSLQPASSVVLETQSEPGNLVVLAAALTYLNEDRRIHQEGFMPVEIVGVFGSSSQ